MTCEIKWYGKTTRPQRDIGYEINEIEIGHGMEQILSLHGKNIWCHSKIL